MNFRWTTRSLFVFMFVATVYCIAVQRTLRPYAQQQRAKAALSEGRASQILFCTHPIFLDRGNPFADNYHDRVRCIRISAAAAEGLQWHSLQDLPYLQRVTVNVNHRVQPQEIESLAKSLPQLESLAIRGVLKDEHFEALRGFDGMQNLDVFLNFGEATYSHASLSAICQLKTLKTLALSGDGIEEHEFFELTKLPELTSLTIVCHQFDNDTLVHLKSLEKLTALHLRRTQVTDDVATLLSHLPRLEILQISGSWFRGDKLPTIVASCPDIRILNLEYDTKFRSKNLAALLKLHKLEELVLSGASIEKEAAGILARHSTLKRLDVSLTNADLSELVHSRSLEWINLEHSSVSESDLEKFLAIPTLKEIVWSKPLPSAVQAELDRRAR